MRITFAELNAYLPTSPEWPDHYEVYFDLRDEAIDAGIFFDSRDELFTEWCEQQGFVVTEDAIEFPSGDTLDVIDAMCDEIAEYYENGEGVTEPDGTYHETGVWQRFGLSGDDAVDYNSGMVSDGIALIREYIKNT